ncbi:GRIP domain-containing protein C119,12 OS=Schizosaccharomyces pombe (strain 972 / ATCC 24843) GN=SPBC119.12 PE=2 SV=1 [Rhizoctonia solani AG-1 IB]|uniref:GRIP domain-containing protein C119,12 n=1 Tax=Thanatephorus cucumeris (strain AG1-IB / isolate 7/3/14) TaxID=1108050 RepID=A0A0B7FH64_THACB|nr:GRIP domain-containing protein C119,12 OS=Schizosaccharomyces pombe (strain 972 / ATCC 24843) GN=SPBC119.12 PE=2 SV=1 [Rhizoctonia solani AG-1 IB]
MDDPTSSPKAATNGLDKQEEEHDVPKTNEERIAQLEQELEKTRAESDSWAEQYRTLLAKLTTMRTTLGNKLQQDAEELDRREQHIVQLNTTNEELSNTIETLKQELNDSLEDSSNLSRELSAFRQRALDSTSSADAELEQMRIEVEHARRDLESTRRELEEERLDREEFEREAAQERVMTEELKAQLVVLRREVEQAAAQRNREAEAVQREKEKSANLQSVLEDFQLAKDMEIRQALAESESTLQHTIKQLAEFKSRALQAEAELAESTHNSDRVNTLEKEVKEKNLLIGKLRHEAVIMNEHLTIALRKLRSSAASSSSSVDRELVSNILLSFLSAPRTDGTRFEMLTILANVLAWGEVEREKAGLQRGGASGAVTPIGTGIMPRKASSASAGGKALELDGTDETDSFSRMWVEFLLKEANQGSAPPTPTGAAPTTGLSALGSPRAASISGLPSLIKTNSSPVSKPSSLASPTTPNPSTPPPRLSTSSLSRSSLGVGLGVPKRSDATSPLARTELEEQ